MESIFAGVAIRAEGSFELRQLSALPALLRVGNTSGKAIALRIADHPLRKVH